MAHSQTSCIIAKRPTMKEKSQPFCNNYLKHWLIYIRITSYIGISKPAIYSIIEDQSKLQILAFLSSVKAMHWSPSLVELEALFG